MLVQPTPVGRPGADSVSELHRGQESIMMHVARGQSVADWVDLGRRWIPARVRYALQRVVSLSDLKLRYFEQKNPLASVLLSDDNRFGSPCRVGIVRNQAQYHGHYVAACLEMGVPFRVLDLAAVDWLEQVGRSGCGILLVWPDGFLSTWSQMTKDRVEVLENVRNLPVVPSAREIWMYEDKRRMTYWLQASGVPHPRTWVFYHRAEADAFARTCELPVVFKANFGAGATGVRILRGRSKLRSLVQKVFEKGFVASGSDRRDRQWGSVLLQEYLADVKEWRMVRIGDSFFGHPKGRRGDFHSGSGVALWDVPEPRHLDLLWDVTEKGSFRSMDVDLFETADGRLLVNELQTVFGASFSIDQLRVDGRAGRFVRAPGKGGWLFEEGDFARNACANERIRDAISRWPDGFGRQAPGTGSLSASDLASRAQ